MPSLVRKVLQDGGPGFCQFAITDACNAHCEFCNFSVDVSSPGKRVFVDVDAARRAIDILAANGVEYIAFVGGEPSLHPALCGLLSHAKQNRMTTLVCTNGATLRSETVDAWREAGLDSAVVSIDSADSDVHEANRGLPGVCARIAEANDRFHALGIPASASVTISRLIPDLNALPPFLESLGFDRVTFSYPLLVLESSFRGFSSSDLVSYSGDELCSLFDGILELKRRYRVLNPSESIQEMKRFVRGEEQRFPCLAGFKYFYLDWEFDLYRCHAWHEPMCKIWSFDSSRLVRDGCTKCMIDCYRDASVLQGVAVAAHDAWSRLSHGQPLGAAQALVSKSSLGSLRALAEDSAWSRRLHRKHTNGKNASRGVSVSNSR